MTDDKIELGQLEFTATDFGGHRYTDGTHDPRWEGLIPSTITVQDAVARANALLRERLAKAVLVRRMEIRASETETMKHEDLWIVCPVEYAEALLIDVREIQK